MDDSGDKPVVRVSDLIVTEDKSPGGRCEENPLERVAPASPGSPILGRYFKLPDLLKSFDPDPPTLDSSLPYIPVYTHLKTFDLAPIERPNTPPIINKLRSSGSMQPKNRSKSRSTVPTDERIDETADQVDQTIHHSRRNTKYEDDVTLQNEST